MPGRNLFAKDSGVPNSGVPDTGLPLTPSPKPVPQDLLAKNEETQRFNRLKKIARAGLDQGYTPSETGSAIGERLTDSFTLGLRGPVTGLANATGGALSDALGMGGEGSFGERYRAGEAAYDDYMKEQTDKAGWAGTGAGLVGGLLTGGGAGRAAVSIPRIAAESAGMAGVEATARARGSLSDRAAEGLVGGLVGGASGAAIGGITQSLLPGFRARRAQAREAARGPDPDTIKDAARQLYRQIDNAGITYDANVYSQLPRNVATELMQAGYNPAMAQHAGIAPLIDELDTIMQHAAANGGAVPFQRLQQLRTMATDVASSNEPGARRLAGIVRNNIDDFVDNAQPSQGFLNGPAANDLWRQARGMWQRASKTEDLLWNVTKAERRAASTASGGNEQNALRQNVRGMLDRAEKPGRYNPFTPEETAAMEEVINGTGVQNSLRSFGNSFGGSGWAPVASGAGTAGVAHMFGLPPELSVAASAGLYGAGRGARALSTRMAQDRVDDLVRLFATGSQAPAAAAAGPPRAISMLDALAQRLAARTAPVATQEMYSGGW